MSRLPRRKAAAAVAWWFSPRSEFLVARMEGRDRDRACAVKVRNPGAVLRLVGAPDHTPSLRIRDYGPPPGYDPQLAAAAVAWCWVHATTFDRPALRSCRQAGAWWHVLHAGYDVVPHRLRPMPCAWQTWPNIREPKPVR